MNYSKVKSKNCTCNNDLMVELGIADACHACIVKRHKLAVGKYKASKKRGKDVSAQ